MPDDNTEAADTESMIARPAAVRVFPYYGPTSRLLTDLDTLDSWIKRNMHKPADLRPLDPEDEDAGGWAYETDSGKNRREISAYLYLPDTGRGLQVDEYARFIIERLSGQRCKLLCESSHNWRAYLMGILRNLAEDYPETAEDLNEALSNEEPISRAEYGYALAREPQSLPPVEGNLLALWATGGDPKYPLPLQIWHSGITLHVDAPTAFHNLKGRLYAWHGKGFVQPVNDGARWHLQFRDVEIQPPDETLTTWLPGREALTPAGGGLVFGALLPGFSVYIPPGEDPPNGHSFTDPHPHIKQMSMVLGALPPWVRLTVTRLHDGLCHVYIAGASNAGRTVVNDLLSFAAELWGDLGTDSKVHPMTAESISAEPPKAKEAAATPAPEPTPTQKRARTKSADPGATVAKFEADWNAGKVGDVEAWAASAGVSGRTLRRYRAATRH